MPTAVAAARQSYADHPMVRLETAPPGPCHAVSLQETLSGTFTACATVILGRCALFSSRCPWDGGEVLRSSGHDSLPAGFGRQPLPAWLAHAGCIAGNSLSVERCLAFNCRKDTHLAMAYRQYRRFNL